jgi:hypothetical protein
MSDQAEHASFQAPDETRGFERGTLDLVRIGGGEIGRLTLQPGWRWSEHPMASGCAHWRGRAAPHRTRHRTSSTTCGARCTS